MIAFARRGALLAITATAACAVGPTYERPVLPRAAPAAYKENTAGSADAKTGGWRPASPSDALVRGKWWEIFGDADLNALEERLVVDNQTLKQSFETYMAARALVEHAKATLYPSLAVGPTASTRVVDGTGLPLFGLPVSASWEPDLFGKIRNTIRQQANAAQVSAATLANVALSQQLSLATYYFQLRGQDLLLVLYDETLANYRESLRITRVLARTGIDGEQSVAQAETTLHTAEANATAVATTRAVYEHAIALLIGEPASAFSMKASPLAVNVPYVPVGVPSQILERRPDIAAAERTMAEMNASIGVATAAYYPDISLGAGAGFQSNSLPKLFEAESRYWTVGGTATETIFDFGARSATVRQSEAQYRAAVAAYRQTVLTAFKEVEDDLVTSRQLAEQTEHQKAAVTSAARYEALAKTRYTTGIDTYLNVITAETSLLTGRQSLVSLQTSQMTTAVQLLAALGGGWDTSQLPSEKDVGRAKP